jgi:CRISPR-associated endonuclease Csn1
VLVYENRSGTASGFGGAFDRIVVSYKPEHDTGGKLHEETAYGIIADPEREGGAILVYRKRLSNLSPNEIERIRDPQLRAQLLKGVGPFTEDKKKLKEARVA